MNITQPVNLTKQTTKHTVQFTWSCRWLAAVCEPSSTSPTQPRRDSTWWLMPDDPSCDACACHTHKTSQWWSSRQGKFSTKQGKCSIRQSGVCGPPRRARTGPTREHHVASSQDTARQPTLHAPPAHQTHPARHHAPCDARHAQMHNNTPSTPPPPCNILTHLRLTSPQP